VIKRLRRIVLNAGTILSVLLCVTAVVLWVRSYRGSISYSINTSGSPHRIEWHDGLVTFFDVGERPMTAGEYLMWMLRSQEIKPGEAILIVRPGARPEPPAPPMMQGERELGSVSALWLCATLSFLPALWLTKASRQRIRRRREIDQQICHTCGYDLRATPDRCPECGRIHVAIAINADQ
jgi:hypothetical protein